MNYFKLYSWIEKKLKIKKRLANVAIVYVLFLMVPFRKHSLEAAASFSNTGKPRFSKFLKNHSDLAVFKLDELSKRQARQFGRNIRFMAEGKLPWKIGILIDATIQNRSSLHCENSKRFNHGKGYVIGHQWTNIVLFVNDIVIPLPPVPFHTRQYCRKNNLKYRTEHEKVVEYIEKIELKDYVGPHNPAEVVVLADSGYDNKRIQGAVVAKGWTMIFALKKRRSVKTKKEYLETPKSKGWHQVERLFKNHRHVKWVTVVFMKNSPRKKRMEIRARQITGWLRYVCEVQLICSEFKKRPKGRRKYLACNDLKAKPRQILLAYRIRWEIEIFHKMVKMFLGFEDVAPKSFASVVSHVHWVYCAYILLNWNPPGTPEDLRSLAEKQGLVEQAIRKKEILHYIQVLTRINGAERLKNELRRVLDSPERLQTTI